MSIQVRILPSPMLRARERRERGGLTSPRRRQEDPHPGRGQGRLEAVLEIPQRGHPQEVQEQAASRLVRHEESVRSASSRGEEGGAETAREAAGRERRRRACGCCCAGAGDAGGSRSVWRSDPVRGPELVSRCECPLSIPELSP